MNILTRMAIYVIKIDDELRIKLIKVMFDHMSFLRRNYLISEFSNYMRKNYPHLFREEEFRQINYNHLEDYLIKACKDEVRYKNE